MSFFPAPDLQKLRSAPNHRLAFYDTPPTPDYCHTPHPTEATTVTDAQGQSVIADSHPLNWDSAAPRGLGLLPISTSSVSAALPIYTSSDSDTSPAFSWPSEFEASHQQPSKAVFDSMRRDSWSEDHHSLSQLLPASSLWDTPSILAPEAASQTSPGHSEYSNSTAASCISSPYGPQDTYLRTAGSPIVKIESPVGMPHTPFHFLPEPAPFDHCGLVNPNDLVANPIRRTPMSAPSPLIPVLTPLDAKPMFARSPHDTSHYPAIPSTEAERAVAIQRQKRGYTRPETASCECDKCGKLFQRTYNLKAHMETHQPNRPHPYACPWPECEKTFVRRTDLMRHEKSVHIRAKDFPCHLCDASFSRKDTLRRHIDDGCPKRPEVKSRASRASRRASAASSLQRASSSHATIGASPIMSTPLHHPMQQYI